MPRGRFAVWMGAALLALVPSVAAAVSIFSSLSVAPPSLVTPADNARVTAPVVLQWSALGPQSFPLGAFGLPGKSTPPLQAHYEIELSDRIDLESHLLYDCVVDNPSYIFNDSFNDPNFTGNYEPQTAFGGGTFYWRVRGLYASPGLTPSGIAIATAANQVPCSTTIDDPNAPTIVRGVFSPVRSFTLTQPGVSSTLHALAMSSMTLVGAARQGRPTFVVVQVRDIGNFPESSAVLNVFADGRPIGTADVPPLAPGASITIDTPWTPSRAGAVPIRAELKFSDDLPGAHVRAQTELVNGPERRATTITGIVARAGAKYRLTDVSGRYLADLVEGPGSNANFAAFTGQRVRVDGYLSVSRSNMIFEATGIRSQ